MGNRKTAWLAIAVVALLFCGFGMGVLPGSTGLLPVRQVYAAMYEVYDILFPMAAVTDVYAPGCQNTTYLPIRAVGNTEVPPSFIGFFEDADVSPFDTDTTMPFPGFLTGINDGLTALEAHFITAEAYELFTPVNSVTVGIRLAPLPDMDENGIPEWGTANTPFIVPVPDGIVVDHTVYVGLVPSPNPGSSELVFSTVASVVPTGTTPEITNVLAGSPPPVEGDAAFQDVLFQVPLAAVDPLPLGYRFIARAAPGPGDISQDLEGLAGLPAENLPYIDYMVAFDAHMIDETDAEVTAFTEPLTISVTLFDGATRLDGMPIFKADTSLDAEYDVVATGTPFAQLPVEQVVENNELVFELDGLSTYVVMLNLTAPVLDVEDPLTVDPVVGPKAGCTPVSILAYGFVEDPPTVRFGANDATDVTVTPLGTTAALISCLTPPGDAVGDVDVFVVNFAGTPDEVFGMLEDAFTYVPSIPMITSIVPDTGAPGQTFTITGTGFAQDVEVTFDYEGYPIVLISVDCDTIVGTVPNLPPGDYEVYVWDQDSGNYDYYSYFTIIEALGRGGAGGPCFIATAAYGTPAADELEVLRTFRDRYLLTNAAGTALMRSYYKYSPAVANVVASNSVLRALTRAVLTAIVTPLW